MRTVTSRRCAVKVFFITFVVISPEMTYKTGQLSVRPSVSCGVNIFKPLKLRDRWADVDETWHVYSIPLVVGQNF